MTRREFVIKNYGKEVEDTTIDCGISGCPGNYPKLVALDPSCNALCFYVLKNQAAKTTASLVGHAGIHRFPSSRTMKSTCRSLADDFGHLFERMSLPMPISWWLGISSSSH